MYIRIKHNILQDVQKYGTRRCLWKIRKSVLKIFKKEILILTQKWDLDMIIFWILHVADSFMLIRHISSANG